MEDLRKLSFFEMQSRIETAEANIKTLLAELRAAQDSLAKLEAKKEAEPLPTFEVGKCYRKKCGGMSGRLQWNTEERRRMTDMAYVYWDGEQSFTVNGWLYLDQSEYDLLPGAAEPLPTWTPPRSLNDCEATSTGDGFRESVAFLHCTHARMKELYRDYIQPADGLWQVKDGKATYLGES